MAILVKYKDGGNSTLIQNASKLEKRIKEWGPPLSIDKNPDGGYVLTWIIGLGDKSFGLSRDLDLPNEREIESMEIA